MFMQTVFFHSCVIRSRICCPLKTENFLNHVGELNHGGSVVTGGTMSQLAGFRKQLQGELAQKGFIKMEPHPCSLNARDPGIVRAVLAAGMYPMVGNLLPPLSGSTKAIVQTARGEKVRIHPHSTSIRTGEISRLDQTLLNQLLVVFDEVTRGESQVHNSCFCMVTFNAITNYKNSCNLLPVESFLMSFCLLCQNVLYRC